MLTSEVLCQSDAIQTISCSRPVLFRSKYAICDKIDDRRNPTASVSYHSRAKKIVSYPVICIVRLKLIACRSCYRGPTVWPNATLWTNAGPQFRRTGGTALALPPPYHLSGRRRPEGRAAHTADSDCFLQIQCNIIRASECRDVVARSSSFVKLLFIRFYSISVFLF